MQDFLKRTWAQVDLDAIAQNYRTVEASLSPGSRVMAIVKADAYGHGAGYISRTLRDAGASWFGVSNLDEAMQIRGEGICQPILILAYTPPEQAACLAENHIAQAVFHHEYALHLSRAAVRAGVSVRVHIKLDTGMTRLGFFCQDNETITAAANDIEAVCSLPGLIPEGIFTHFASADEESEQGYTRRQFTLFQKVIARLEERGIRFSLRHCCNSAAAMRFPDMHMDMVRAGLVLYGLSPAPWMEGTLPLIPAMEMKTVVSMVKTVPAEIAVSYGRTFVSPSEIVLATLPVGYADGYSRNLSNCAYMLVCGHRAPVVGRVCMDQCLLDVTGIEGVEENTTVTIFGRDGSSVLPVEELAALSGTIHYETICLIGKRVPRIFQSGGQVVGRLNYIAP